jgi:hypothetical protein
LDELDWVIHCGRQHLGEERAARYLRKFYPWYVERLGVTRTESKQLLAGAQVAPTLDEARSLFG